MTPQLQRDAKAPTEGGLMNHRIEFIREQEQGVTPDNPEWRLYSDNMINAWNYQPDAGVEPKRGLGAIDPETFFGGAVEYEAEFAYHWQQPFLDGNGDPNDASYDFLFREPSGLFNATHSVVGREVHPGGGTTGAGFRIYNVGKGGHPSELEAEADAGESMPIPMTLTYMFVAVNSYIINQPQSATTLVVKSTDAADTTQTVTIEDEGATTSETVTLNGTTLVATTSQFSDIDAVELSDDAIGDVVVSVNDGGGGTPTAGATITKIAGRATNSPPGSTQLSGDLGVPVLGSGSHQQQVEPESSRTWMHFRGDRIERVAGAQIGPRINSATLSADNNVDTNERVKSRSMAIDRGVLDVTLEASIAGPHAGVSMIMDHLQTKGADVEWEFSVGDVLVLPDAVVTEPGELAYEAEQVAMYIDTTLQGEGIRLEDGQGNVVIA